MQQLINQITHLSRADRIHLIRVIADSLASEEMSASEAEGLSMALARAKAVDQGEE